MIAVGCKLEAPFTFGIDHRLKIESARTLQHQLAMLTGHELAHVKRYEKHLLIQMRGRDDFDYIARLAEQTKI